MGSAMKLSKDIGRLLRYSILKILADEGLYDYLREPRTYGQILAELNFVDSDFTRELFDVLVQDEENTVIREDSLFRVNPEHSVPTKEEIIASIDPDSAGFLPLFEGFVGRLPARLRREPIELSATLEDPGRALMNHFDDALDNKMYSAMRNAAFVYLPRRDRNWLRGKKLLDAGCGSGRETAELWLKLKGNIHITAIDSVPSMISLSEQNFSKLLDEIGPGHPPITEENRPVFQQASVTGLPFEDNSFDAAFHANMLHWITDPRKGISEMVRVVRPGGLIFGVQAGKANISSYMDIAIRISENCHGFFWLDEFERWYSDLGMTPEILKPIGLFFARKPESPSS